MKAPRPLPPVPRAVPVEPYVAPAQMSLLDHLDAPPTPVASTPEVPAARPAPAPTVVEVDVRPPGLQALRASIPDADDMPESDIPAGPAPAPRRPAPRMPFIAEIVHMARLTFGWEAWAARAADVMGVTDRTIRRWRVLGNPETRPKPTAAHLEAMRDAAEERHAELADALRLSGRLPKPEAAPVLTEPASEAADAPHVRSRQAIAEALALHIKERQAARVERPKAPSKAPRVDDA